jgi:dihydroxy-acid dehydratase
MKAGLLPYPEAMTVNGKSMGDNRRESVIENAKPSAARLPLKANAGFINLKGNPFDSAIMKTSGISPEFRERYLSNPKDPEAFEGNAMVFDGPEDYHARIDDPAQGIDEHTILFMRGAGPIGYPGGAEVVNMQPPAYLIKKGTPRAGLYRRWPPVRRVGLPSISTPRRKRRSAAARRCSRPATASAST